MKKFDLSDRIFCFLNGVVYVDRKNKADKRKALKNVKDSARGKNLVIYPEGTWNLTPSKSMLPLNWGPIDLAKETGVPIIPLVLESHPDGCYAKYGDPIYVKNGMDKLAGIELLEEAMATLKWEIWEMFPKISRYELELTVWDKERTARIATYPKLDFEYEKQCVLRISP